MAMTPVPPAPMLAATGPLPSDASAYCFEAKWDGARMLARCGHNVQLFSRHATNLTGVFQRSPAAFPKRYRVDRRSSTARSLPSTSGPGPRSSGSSAVCAPGAHPRT